VGTTKNRSRTDYGKPRTPRDLTDDEGARGAPPIPPARQHGGDKRTGIIREVVVNPRIDVSSIGCRWRAIPKDLAARRTATDALIRWNDDGTRIHHARSVKCPEPAQRDASETAGIKC
jgi:transposase